MRVGDTYKIKSMLEIGSSDEEILNRFKYEYPGEMVQSFIDAYKPKPAPKKRAPKKKAVKEATPDFLDD